MSPVDIPISSSNVHSNDYSHYVFNHNEEDSEEAIELLEGDADLTR